MNFVSNQSLDLISKQSIAKKKKKKKKWRNKADKHFCLVHAYFIIIYDVGSCTPFLNLNNDVLSCLRRDESMYTYCHPERIMFLDFTLGVYFERR